MKGEILTMTHEHKHSGNGFLFFLSMTFAFTLMALTGCSEETPSAVSPDAAIVYQYAGPGSSWTVDLYDDATFIITHAPSLGEAIDMTINGTYARFDTGFLKLTVTTATGTADDLPVAGAEAYALEVPGFAFILKPIGDDSEVIPMVTAGDCPVEDVVANWIHVKMRDGADATSTEQDFFGTFAYEVATGIPSLPTKYSLESFTALGSGTLSAGTCADGIMEVDEAVMYLTSQGGAIVHANAESETEDSFIFAFPAEENLDSGEDLAGDYAGLVFDSAVAEGQDSLFPVAITITGTVTTVTGTGTQLTDVETGAVGTGTASISLTALNSPSDGFMTGTITIATQTGDLACMATLDVEGTGKNTINCIAQSPSDNTQYFNILMVSKE